MQSKDIRAFIYCRVSTEEQGRGYSLPTQRDACRRYAEERGYTVVGVFEDEYTGTELDRPGLSAMSEAVPRERPDAVVVYDLDRLGRTVAVQAIIEREMERAGIRLEYVLGGYQDTPEGELLKLIKGSIAQYENRQRVERSRRGKNGRVLAGSVFAPGGHAPFGYDYVSERHHGRLVINEGQAAVVQKMYHWLTVERLSSYAIARRLHEMDVPTLGDVSPAVVKKGTRGEWSPATVRRIIRNTVYKGQWHWGKTRSAKRNGKSVHLAQPQADWLEVDVPAIVDADTWGRAQACLTENKVQSRRNAKREYLLRGLVFCSCGRRWTGRYKNHLERAYYRCPSSESEGWRKACPARFGIRQEVLETAVWRAVMDYLMHPETMMAEIERQRSTGASEAARRADRQRAIAAALWDVDRKLEALLSQALEGFPKAVVDRHRGVLVEQRRELELAQALLDQEREREEISDATVVTLKELAATVRQAEPSLTPGERQRILELLRLRIDILDRERIRVSGLITGAVVETRCSSPR